MKFKTQHRRFKVYSPGKSEPLIYGAHRDYKSIWITSPGGKAIVFQKECTFVSEAKKFMSAPYLS